MRELSDPEPRAGGRIHTSTSELRHAFLPRARQLQVVVGGRARGTWALRTWMVVSPGFLDSRIEGRATEDISLAKDHVMTRRTTSLLLPDRALTSIVAAALALTGCSDDSTAPEDDGGSTQSTTFYAFFLDDAVNGLRYTSAGGDTNTTDLFGVCELEIGAPATFYVDDIELGTVASPTTRITPSSFGVIGTNIARFVQSIDTTPGVPGIELTGLDLPPDPINFNQGNDSFGMDAVVLQAVADAAKAGGTGVLVGVNEALQALAAGLSTVFEAADFADRAFFPIEAGGSDEPCVVRTRADGTGVSVCRDDIDADPASAAPPFTWTIDDPALVIEYDFGSGVEERVRVERLGTTGNRISTQVTTECLTCDPDVEPTTALSTETFILPLPITGAELDDQTIAFTSPDDVTSATFNGDGTGSLDDGGTLVTFTWAIGDVLTDVLTVRGTGSPGTELLYIELFLIDGTVLDGTFAALSGVATDSNANGVIDDAEVDASIVYDAVELVATGL